MEKNVCAQTGFFCLCVQKDVPLEVNREMASILQSSRFSQDFKIVMSDEHESSPESAWKVNLGLKIESWTFFLQK